MHITAHLMINNQTLNVLMSETWSRLKQGGI